MEHKPLLRKWIEENVTDSQAKIALDEYFIFEETGNLAVDTTLSKILAHSVYACNALNSDKPGRPMWSVLVATELYRRFALQYSAAQIRSLENAHTVCICRETYWQLKHTDAVVAKDNGAANEAFKAIRAEWRKQRLLRYWIEIVKKSGK